jgi:Asp-tRNA(Asn)/Glu-tRNA(Gln) amidotransferase B subunit
MLDIIDRYLEVMRANRTESGEMQLRYDGAVQILEKLRAEVAPKLEVKELPSGPSDSVPPSAEASPSKPAARKRRTKKTTAAAAE